MGSASVKRATVADPSAELSLDTTAGSILHRLAGYQLLARPKIPPEILVYLIGVAVTYGPLLLAAWLSPVPMTEPSPTCRLPFLYDWNVAFMFVVSFPLILVLTVTDQAVLASSLRRVQVDGIVSISPDSAGALCAAWRRNFRAVNIFAQALGVCISGVLVFFNYRAYSPESVGFWISTGNRLLPVGYVFLACIFLFYALVPVYVLRSFATSLFLKELVAHAEIRMLPFHPDNSAGLRPVGHLGLRNQYALTVCGFNLLLLILVSMRYLTVPSSLYGLMAAAALAYVVVGPLVFLGPLLPFRGAMLRTKTDLMSEVAHRLRIELQRLRRELASGQITKEDEELIDRLRKFGAVINELPVWPFDAGTLRKFLTAYVIPVVSAIGFSLLKALLASRLKWPHT